MLQVKGVSCFFGGLVAIDNVSLEVGNRELVGLMGPNGAGKTTLFNIINSFIHPARGKVYLKGEDITGLPTHQITKRGLVRTFQNIRIFEHLNVLGNVEVGVPESKRTGFYQTLFFASKVRLIDKFVRERAIRCLEVVGLSHLAQKGVSSLTFGQQRLLGIARALACEPEILLLDEPSAGLNQDETLALSGVIQEIHRDGVAIFIIEHDIGMLMNLARRIIVLNKGKKIMEGTPDKIREEDKVIQAYFGRKRKCLV